MSGATYFLETFGCQMNILDSQLVEGQLRARGLAPTASFREADLILFNTCSVRQHAEDKVLSRLGELRAHKLRRPETIIGVIGCMAEREKEGLFVKAPHVDLLCGPGELDQLPALIDEVQARHDHVTALTGTLSRRTEVLQRALEYDSLEALDQSRTPAAGESVLQSYVRVQRGCDKFCTYCVVPFTRGAERSRAPQAIVDEVRMLAARGCREVTLLGQTVNSYVQQEDGRPVPFARLLERVHEVGGIERIRFVTSYPADWDEDIFRVMRDYPRIMPYLHIPAQSGSDAVLRRMKRGYTVAQYLRLMDTARKYLPAIAIAGDFIVGFCGETDADFQASIDLVRRVEYAGLFVFKYSPRPGTAADRGLDDDIPDEVKAARNNELLAVQREYSAKRRAACVGQTVEVLIEGFSKLARKAQGEIGSAIRTRQVASPTFSAAKNQSGACGTGFQPVSGGSTGFQPGSACGTGFQPVVSTADSAAINQESEQDRGAEISREFSHQLVGRTPHDFIVVLDAPASYIGAIVRVHVERASAQTLFGRVVEAISQPSHDGASRRRALANSDRAALTLPVMSAKCSST